MTIKLQILDNALFLSVPGVQWFLDHASSHQDEVDDGDSVFLSNLHCYPEVMIAVQGRAFSLSYMHN